MVAKLKTSFLKSGFQFFCHRSPFAAGANPNGNNRQEPSVERIKSNSQFNSSPDLTVTTNGTHPANLSNRSQPEDDTHQNTSNFFSKASRSVSASGRVIDAESPIKSEEIPHSQTQSTSIAKQKKIPKYLAKSKSRFAQNNDEPDPELVIDQKPRSKSSSCLNREAYNNNPETDVLLTNRIHIDLDTDLDHMRQFNRHSFPSACADTTNNNDLVVGDIITKTNSDNSSSQKSNSSSSSDGSSGGSDNNKFSGNMITDLACKPTEFFVLNSNEDQHERIDGSQNDHAGNNNMKTTLNSSGGNLYKTNTQSIAQLKQIRMNQAMNRNNNQSELQNGKNISDKNINAETTQARKPIKFNGNGAINSILSQKHKKSLTTKLQNNLDTDNKNGIKLEKKAVRFADSLGLELESHIHIADTNPYRRRMVRIHPTHNAPNYFANNLLYQRTPQFAYASNNGYGAINNNNHQNHYSNEAVSVSRNVYLPQKPANIQHLNNHTNITHFHNDKVLRHQGHEVRRFIETKNHFEDPNNGTCLYDDIINKVAFGNDNKYQQNGSLSHIYTNNINQQRHVEKSSSYEALKRQQNHLRGITYNTNKNGSLAQQQQASSNNVTITTRINNGKLESEV